MTPLVVLSVVPRDVHFEYLTNFQTLFMYTMTQWGGFKALGIMYSLPFALLIWA